MYVCVYIYIYIYIREDTGINPHKRTYELSEEPTGAGGWYKTYIYIYIYIFLLFIYLCIERERYRY